MKFIKRLVKKALNAFDKYVDGIQDAPHNVYTKGDRYTPWERPIDEAGKKEISDDVKRTLQQREALGMESSKNPLDDKDKAIERATDNYWRKKDIQARQKKSTKSQREF